MMKEQKDKKIKVAFPHMGTISVAWSAALRKFGVEAYVPPYTSKKTLSLGVKNSPEAVCLPYKLILVILGFAKYELSLVMLSYAHQIY